MKYDGLRFRAECTLAGKPYGGPFGVDIAFGDPMIKDPERIVAPDTLGFAGIAPPSLLVYPVETHVAEKLHAYTLPRNRPNSRVKDLPDLALMATAGPIAAAQLRAALHQTFDFRATHGVPASVPSPPLLWQSAYEAMARAEDLRWRSLPELINAVAAFLDPILTSEIEATWNPNSWSWEKG